jgi:hypothetical protein
MTSAFGTDSFVKSSANSEKLFEKPDKRLVEVEDGLSFFSNTYRVRVANNLEYREKAYQFVNKIYSEKGWSQSDQNGLWLTIHHALSDTIVLIAEDNDNNICGTLSLIFDSPIGIPADASYQLELNSLRNQGKKLCEIVSFGTDPSFKYSVRILAGLFFCAYLIAWRVKNSTDFVIAIRPYHSDFYTQSLHFRKIGQEKKCERANGISTVLLQLPLSLPSEVRNKTRIFPLHILNYPAYKEIRIANKLKEAIAPMSDEEFFIFFMEKTNLWGNATPEQKKYIKSLYPVGNVDHNMVSRLLAKSYSKLKEISKDHPSYKKSKTIKN